MLLVGVALLLIIGIIFGLTDGIGRRRKAAAAFDADRMAAEVAGVTEKALGLYAQSRRPVVGAVLLGLMDRIGVDRAVGVTHLERVGFPSDGLAGSAPQGRSRLLVVRAGEGLEDALERAMLVGIQVARIDDDYACVGDDYADLEALARRAEAAEIELFGDERRERYALYGKAALVLQDMLQDAPEGERRDAIRNLLEAFDGQIESLQAELEQAMAKVPEPETLVWGDSRDRRLYYFKMGVTNSLRRSGHLQSLGHLYRCQGVNYDVEEAYDLAAQECPPLVLAGQTGIDRLLRMGPAEVQGLVQRALPGSDG